MSRKGVSTICKSKQIPRIFQRRNQSVCARGRGSWCLADSTPLGTNSDNNQVDSGTFNILLDSSESCNKQADDNKKLKQKDNGLSVNSDYSTGSWSGNCCQGINSVPVTEDHEQRVVKSPDTAETVDDIEKWLKTRMESVSSIDLDTMKSEVEEEEEEVGVDRYLADDLPHAFLGKDPDGLSIDIDLSDKKLNLGYDPILQELHSDKLLEVCEKNDQFILPEFQLDHLDPLALSPDDMMVAGEILPSTSNQHNIMAIDSKQNISSAEVKNYKDNSVDIEAEELCDKPIQADIYELVGDLEDVSQVTHMNEEDASRFVQEINHSEYVHLANVSQKPRIESRLTAKRQPKLKTKLEPRIMKRHKKVSSKTERNGMKFIGDECHMDGKDGIMAVVAISTDKVSNMTQIVINTGTEEQIYQGKTSELIEATGNFSKLSKINAAGNWSNEVESSLDSTTETHSETFISNALEELGITDESLKPTVINENGKAWLCPREDCNREFSKLYALKGHLLAHYGIRPFKCDYENCGWAFHSEFKLKRHKETHLKRKDFACEVPGCNRRFTTIYNLSSHEKLHTRPCRIMCQVPDCHEKFQTKRALEFHMKSHDQSHAPYVCNHDGCGKRYYSSNALTSHQRCHSYKEIDVKCSWPGCGKVFDKPCRLKAHLRSHTGCKPYPCTYQDCQWAFSSSSKLKRHQKKHTNERKFICDVVGCGKAFMRSEHLKEHGLTHKEGRYFQCYMCDAHFSAKSSLYVHIKKHQVKEAVDTITRGSSKNHKRKTKVSQVSREKSIAKVANTVGVPRIEGLYGNSPIQSTMIKVPANEDPIASTRCFVQSSNDILGHVSTDNDQTTENNLSYSDVDNCEKSLKTQFSLRTRVLTIHGEPIEDCDKSTIGVSDATSVSNMDYILYASPNVMTKGSNQMVMVEPGDAIILSTSPKNVSCLPEPEPPPLNTPTPRNSQSSYHVSMNNRCPDQRAKRSNQGSARTGLTCADVWKLKSNVPTTDSTVVGASDVVLGTPDLTEGLLLTEELPSMYYQDDIVGTECQILLLDSGSSENTINLRGLE